MIGWMEFLIVGAVALCLAAMAFGAGVLLFFRTRAQGGSSDRIAALEAELQRLRADLDNLKK